MDKEVNLQFLKGVGTADLKYVKKYAVL